MINSVEYLHDGDVASVALQYSYLASWLYPFAEPGYGADTARALFKEIYRFWITLLKDVRPRLFLHGLSLGATNCEQSTALIEVLGDPFVGALWSGPPYSSRLWHSLADCRDPGSSAWLPRFRDGSFVRFMKRRDRLPGRAECRINRIVATDSQDPQKSANVAIVSLALSAISAAHRVAGLEPATLVREFRAAIKDIRKTPRRRRAKRSTAREFLAALSAARPPSRSGASSPRPATSTRKIS